MGVDTKRDMTEREKSLGKKLALAAIAAFCICCFLCIGIFFYDNYRRDLADRTDLLEREKERAERYAALIGSVLLEVREGLTDFQNLPRISAMLSKPTFDISGSDLERILKNEVQEALKKSENAYGPLFSGVYIVDRKGVLRLNAFQDQDLSGQRPIIWAGLSRYTDEPALLLPEGDIAVFAAGHSSGPRIVATINSQVLLNDVMSEKGGAEYCRHVLYQVKNIFIPSCSPVEFGKAGQINLESLMSGVSNLLETTYNEKRQRVIATKVAIPAGPLFLVRTVPESMVYRQSLYGGSSLFALISGAIALLGTLVLAALAARPLIGGTRSPEHVDREKNVQEKNEALVEDTGKPEKAETQVPLQEKFFNALTEHLPVAIYIKDAQSGSIVFWNKAMEKQTQTRAEEIVDKDPHGLPTDMVHFHLQDVEILEKNIGEKTIEESVKSLDLGSRIVRSRRIPIVDDTGRPAYLIGIVEDITEQRGAEKALVESEERYRMAIANIDEGIAIQKDDEIVYANRCYLEMHGLSEMPKDGPLLISRLIHPDDLKRAKERMEKSLKEGVSYFRDESRGIKKDGTPFYVDVSMTTITIGGETCFLVYIRDITELKQVQEQEKKRTHELAEMVRELQILDRVSVDRELRMIELKKQINVLRTRLGEKPLFNMDEIEGNIAEDPQS